MTSISHTTAPIKRGREGSPQQESKKVALSSFFDPLPVEIGLMIFGYLSERELVVASRVSILLRTFSWDVLYHRVTRNCYLPPICAQNLSAVRIGFFIRQFDSIQGMISDNISELMKCEFENLLAYDEEDLDNFLDTSMQNIIIPGRERDALTFASDSIYGVTPEGEWLDSSIYLFTQHLDRLYESLGIHQPPGQSNRLNPETQEELGRALHNAIDYDLPGLARRILSDGAPLKEELIFAIDCDSLKATRAILDYVMDLSPEFLEALDYALGNGTPEMMEMFLEKCQQLRQIALVRNQQAQVYMGNGPNTVSRFQPQKMYFTRRSYPLPSTQNHSS